ncbi:MAG: hypothetical protein COA45_08190 [Zetaproteobacteria bacterium]|nr:MAG: hypothetical protein COA45_08190 [Zetaproteobacteria bacterium]
MNIVFVHGWGMNSKIWDAMSASFLEADCSVVDLGFIGGDENTQCSKAIYITHSLGTMWALKHHLSDIEALVVVNGFSCFLDFAQARVLRTMQKRLLRNPSVQMQSFWESCGVPDDAQNQFSDPLNTDKLHEGLEWLINWDLSEPLRALQAPVLSLSGRNDFVLPHNKMKTQWAGYDMQTHEHGGHVLPLSHPQWCADQIKGFISEFELER